MFTSTSKNWLSTSVKSSIAALVLATTSLSAQANEVSVTESLVTNIEQNLTHASQEMFSTVQHEIMLSLQTQIAEQVFELTATESATEQADKINTAIAAAKAK
ncbi:hypothetical protein EXU30_06695 [Shewanella maritima]|uniref:Uncharacterized protein n=1 Tax=Shewanella maritima TaxID=2520507 RepID=A0A411PFQ4_9GAMM|nr:hypothetical protein [Shewanella maritima]QBF82419.1 hypothetical protein EXU30_06695 [Shewanella maritima]